jgi:glutamine---fructose-6-phosphate transaminase (isomerizing)
MALMCGIFGILVKKGAGIPGARIASMLQELLLLSESRGKEAAGVAFRTTDTLNVFKAPCSASMMLREASYREEVREPIAAHTIGEPLMLIGHSRLVTNGRQEENSNNQPVIKEGIVGIHNGIVVNDAALWKEYPDLRQKCEVDTEVILALERHFLDETRSLSKATAGVFEKLRGASSVALLFQDVPSLLLATNNGSLYVCTGSLMSAFASERYILERFALHNDRFLDPATVKQIPPGNGCSYDLATLNTQPFGFHDERFVQTVFSKTVPLKDLSPKQMLVHQPKALTAREIEREKKLLVYTPDVGLVRCTKCVLPETFPFITFDEHGVCNYCRAYKHRPVHGEKALRKKVARYRGTDGKPDCLVAISGGRDSCYGLHYIKRVLKMNPIAYTYDWGMVTDLARRNISRMCGELGVEHIIISADIRKKRDNIRRNIEAWLKAPHLGMVPIFMAGDKQFFYYANKLMKETGIQLMVFCENWRFEKTAFKSAFCGVREGFDRVYHIPLYEKLVLTSFLARQCLRNPRYFNPAFLDSLFAYFSAYMLKHDYIFLFEYIEWGEDIVMGTLLDQYDWELATDTVSSWRIGDGTAPFYNYIYHTVAGFSENDTFRSNEIREGVRDRATALQLVYRDNAPRYESFRWYCDTVGLDYAKTVKAVQAIPKLYRH